MSASAEREIAISSAARRLDASRRAQLLEESCGDDVDLRKRIRELLEADETAGDFLEDLN